MRELGILQDLVVVLGVAIPTVAIAHRLGIPAIVGFFFVGAVIGPHGLALIPNAESVTVLAELGVLLLLFTIGLELSLTRVMQLGRVALQGGALQVGGTLLAVAAVATGLGVPINRALFYGGLVALSSTAVVFKVYADRGELDTPHGRVVVSILLFQDLCVVPLMLFMPMLADAQAGTAVGNWVGIARSLLVVAILVAGGRVVVPWVLDRIVLLRDRELFTLCIGFFGLGAAFATASFGLSLALGAFVAGLVISESEYGLQAMSNVLPFHDVFSGIFFASVGMLLDARFLIAQPLLVVGATVGILLLKGLLSAAVVLSLRRGLQASIASGFSLAQVGEFSFILAGVGVPLGLFAGNDYQLFLAVSVLTMVATPFMIARARQTADGIERVLGRSRFTAPLPDEESAVQLKDHTIIVGYGFSGRRLAHVLDSARLPYVVLEQNGQAVRSARREGVPIFFGDGTRRAVLERVGCERARVILFVISSTADERRGVVAARELNPAVRIIVRTHFVRAIEDLTRLGASEVVVEEFEASVELFALVLEFYEVPSNTIRREVDAVRSEHYSMLRGESRPDLQLDTLKHLGIHSALDLVQVEEDSAAVGGNPSTLNLRRDTGVTLVAVVRDGKAFYKRDATFQFRVGDTAVLVGEQEALERGAALFRSPAPAH